MQYPSTIALFHAVSLVCVLCLSFYSVVLLITSKDFFLGGGHVIHVCTLVIQHAV